MAAVLGPFTVAELIQIGLGVPAAAKTILDVVDEVKALHLKPTDPVPVKHAARFHAALTQLVPSTATFIPPDQGFAEGGGNL